jgi:hypothetical protein
MPMVSFWPSKTIRYMHNKTRSREAIEHTASVRNAPTSGAFWLGFEAASIRCRDVAHTLQVPKCARVRNIVVSFCRKITGCNAAEELESNLQIIS